MNLLRTPTKHLLHRCLANAMHFSTQQSNVRVQQVHFFSQINDWWDEQSGSMRTLHKFNRARIQFLNQAIFSEFNKRKSFQSLRFLDIGCGGGILSESLSRKGGNVIALDPTQNCIQIAKDHISMDPQISERVKFLQKSQEEYYDEFEQQVKQSFDVVCVSQVIEHVENKQLFIANAARFLKRAMIVLGQSIMNQIPRGTHDWNLFLSVDKARELLKNERIKVKKTRGALPSNFNLDMKLVRGFTNINYLLYGVKS